LFKVKAEEVVLGKRLINCEKEKEKLNEKCVSYRRDLDILEEQLRQLKEENHSTKEEIKKKKAKNTEIVSMLTRSDQKVIELESELSEKEIVLKEKNALISENAELRALTAQQHNCLKLCHQEIEDSREELNILETIISQLSLSTSEEFKWKKMKHQLSSSSTKEKKTESCYESNKPLIKKISIKKKMKETEIQKPRAKKKICNGAEHLSNDKKKQENSKFCGLETEKKKLIRSQGGKLTEIAVQFCLINPHRSLKKGFKEFLYELTDMVWLNREKKTTLECWKLSCSQKKIFFFLLLVNLLVTKKSSQLSALEKQLEEKTIAYSAAAARNTELEQQLMGKNRRIHELETTISKEHEQITSAFEKAKLVRLEQHKEMEKQI
ncbi:CCD18 protein, partial [Fregetta grallaria]|nr:CCD18 protein [Fregetta grallaria]